MDFEIHQKIIDLRTVIIKLDIRNENLSNAVESMYFIFCGILMTCEYIYKKCPKKRRG